MTVADAQLLHLYQGRLAALTKERRVRTRSPTRRWMEGEIESSLEVHANSKPALLESRGVTQAADCVDACTLPHALRVELASMMVIAITAELVLLGTKEEQKFAFATPAQLDAERGRLLTAVFHGDQNEETYTGVLSPVLIARYLVEALVLARLAWRRAGDWTKTDDVAIEEARILRGHLHALEERETGCKLQTREAASNRSFVGGTLRASVNRRCRDLEAGRTSFSAILHWLLGTGPSDPTGGSNQRSNVRSFNLMKKKDPVPNLRPDPRRARDALEDLPLLTATLLAFQVEQTGVCPSREEAFSDFATSVPSGVCDRDTFEALVAEELAALYVDGASDALKVLSSLGREACVGAITELAQLERDGSEDAFLHAARVTNDNVALEIEMRPAAMSGVAVVARRDTFYLRLTQAFVRSLQTALARRDHELSGLLALAFRVDDPGFVRRFQIFADELIASGETRDRIGLSLESSGLYTIYLVAVVAGTEDPPADTSSALGGLPTMTVGALRATAPSEDGARRLRESLLGYFPVARIQVS